MEMAVDSSTSEKQKSANSHNPERRHLARYLCTPPRPVRLIARPNFNSISALVHDFSLRGIGLVCDRTFEPGTLLAVQLQSRNAGLSGILTAKVKHLTDLANGKWLVGCSLSRSLTDDEVFTLLRGPVFCYGE
jgi:hypothetical protein